MASMRMYMPAYSTTICSTFTSSNSTNDDPMRTQHTMPMMMSGATTR